MGAAQQELLPPLEAALDWMRHGGCPLLRAAAHELGQQQAARAAQKRRPPATCQYSMRMFAAVAPWVYLSSSMEQLRTNE